jgi:hypothetical protein
MTVNILRTAVTTALPVLLAAFALPAFAMPVNFTTTSEFCTGACITGSASLNITNSNGIVMLTTTGYAYTNVFPADVNLDPDGNPFDDKNAATVTTHASGIAPISLAGNEFLLTITQTSPVPGGTPISGSFLGQMSGTLGRSGTGAIVTFNTDSIALDNITYSLDVPQTGPNAFQWYIPMPGNGLTGVTSLTMTVTPEPTFMMLTGLGFAGLAFIAYRRKRTV